MICKYCGKTEAKKRGLCNACYMRWYRHGSCEYRKPKKSNADRIRSMSDEELANMWWSYVDCGECPKHRECKMTGQDCLRLALEWLREEKE